MHNIADSIVLHRGFALVPCAVCFFASIASPPGSADQLMTQESVKAAHVHYHPEADCDIVHVEGNASDAVLLVLDNKANC